jgi:hypothetical protein
LVYRWITFANLLTIGVEFALDLLASTGMLAMQSGKTEWMKPLTDFQKHLVGYLGRMGCGCWGKGSNAGLYQAQTQRTLLSTIKA